MKNNRSGRIYAIMLRHLKALLVSWSRLSETFYWPMLNILIWGYVSKYLASQGSSPSLLIIFLAGFIFWNIMHRSQEEMSVGFMDDLWSRNFANIFASPVSTWEYLIALMLTGIIKLVLSTTLIWFVAAFVFHFNLLSIGFYLFPFIFNLLLTGWWVGFIINGLVFRFGYDVEALSWTIIFILQPFSGVYYPLSVMPDWMQFISRFIPSSYIFEGLRMLIYEGRVESILLMMSFALNIVYIIFSLFFYKKMFDAAREKGYLTKLF